MSTSPKFLVSFACHLCWHSADGCGRTACRLRAPGYPRRYMSDLGVDNYGLLKVEHFVAFSSHIVKLAAQVGRERSEGHYLFDFDPSCGVCFGG